MVSELEKLKFQKRLAEKIKSVKKPYYVKIKGKKIVVFPKVYAPRTDTMLFLDSMRVEKGEKVLDMGSGTGILGIFAAKKAGKVVCADISPYAIENIRRNIKPQNLKSKVKAVRSDVFKNIKGKFDVIVANFPYTNWFSENYAEISHWDSDNKAAISFLNNVNKFLGDKGRSYFGWGDFADQDLILKLVSKNKLVIDRIFTRKSKEGPKCKFFVFEIRKSKR